MQSCFQGCAVNTVQTTSWAEATFICCKRLSTQQVTCLSMVHALIKKSYHDTPMRRCQTLSQLNLTESNHRNELYCGRTVASCCCSTRLVDFKILVSPCRVWLIVKTTVTLFCHRERVAWASPNFHHTNTAPKCCDVMHAVNQPNANRIPRKGFVHEHHKLTERCHAVCPPKAIALQTMTVRNQSFECKE